MLTHKTKTVVKMFVFVMTAFFVLSLFSLSTQKVNAQSAQDFNGCEYSVKVVTVVQGSSDGQDRRYGTGEVTQTELNDAGVFYGNGEKMMVLEPKNGDPCPERFYYEKQNEESGVVESRFKHPSWGNVTFAGLDAADKNEFFFQGESVNINNREAVRTYFNEDRPPEEEENTPPEEVPTPPPEEAIEEEPATCTTESGSPFGWLICPVIEGAQDFLDWIFGSLFRPLLHFEVEGGSIDQVWAGFRTIANIIFVLAFLAVIYAAATGSVLSAYDVRKLLPRLFVVAIMVQLSFFFSKFLLDASNIIGDGIRSLMLYPVQNADGFKSLINPGGLPQQMPTLLDGSPISGAVPLDIKADISDIFVGGIAGVALLITLFVLFLYCVTGMIMLIGAFIVRDIAIVVLIVISPIAFALMVLPGTENYFRTWWKWYFGLLMVYPAMSAFLAAGALVAGIWTSVDAFVWPAGLIISTVALFMPYFLAPKVLSYAGQAAGALTGAFSVINDKKNKLKETGFYNRRKEDVRNKAWTAASPAIDKFGQSAVPFSSKIAGATSLSRAKSAATIRKRTEDQSAAASLLLDQEIPSIRATHPTAPDDAVRDHLLGILNNSGRADGERIAASEKLLALYGTDEKAVAGVRSFIQDGRKSGDKHTQDMANTVLQRNLSTISGDAPHIYKGDGAEGAVKALAGTTESVLKHKKGAMQDMLSFDDQRVIGSMVGHYVAAANNDNLSGQIAAGNAKVVYDAAQAHFASTGDRALLDQMESNFNPDGTLIP